MAEISRIVAGKEISQDLYKDIQKLIEKGIEIISLMSYNIDKIAVVR